MATICITGGTGMIGTGLALYLSGKGHQIHILTRNPSAYPSTANIRYFSWDPDLEKLDPVALEKADALIHLAGANVAEKRWAAKRKKEILDSRVKSSQLITRALRQYPHNIQCVASASAIGWYGPDEKNIFTENMPAHNDFLGNTCRAWEESIEPVTNLGIRLVKLRTGIVLSNEGGALEEFKKPLRFGIAPILGSGRQIISWIHIQDLIRLFEYA
ncbi:MAG: TIGR01777 family oxidoreductase, partial [Bacteroidetes bacterium]|nr:TIGR01777 family oxidoreductase [Bacteroidota bacterium]